MQLTLMILLASSTTETNATADNENKMKHLEILPQMKREMIYNSAALF